MPMTACGRPTYATLGWPGGTLATATAAVLTRKEDFFSGG